MEIFIKVLISLFAAVGIIFTCQKIIGWFLSKTKGDIEDMAIILRMKKTDIARSLEYALRSVLFSTGNIITEKGAPKIYISDTGLNKKEKEICRALYAENRRVILVNEQEIKDISSYIK